MKKIYSKLLFLSLLFLTSASAFSQINTGEMPESFKDNLSQENVDHIFLTPPSMELIIAEDLQDEKNGTMMKIARLIPVGVSINNSGTWDKLSDGTSVWRLTLSSENAKSCAVHFDEFTLPSGTKLFVYNKDRSVILGPYTSEDNMDGANYAIGILYGDEMTIEYSVPPTKSLNGSDEVALPALEISKFSYIYRGEDLFDNRVKSTGYGASGDCQVNANCTEGNNWRKQQEGVARIYVVDGMSAGYCTGTLVNNTAVDGTPYFLTADHCGGDVSASDFGEWVFRFNYESPGCTATSQPTGNNITGCTKKARGPLNGGSDFLLVQLTTTALNLKNIGAIYNGWRKTTTSSPSGISFHHPAGDIKKISTYTSALSTATYNGGTGNVGATGAHWMVYWAATANGHGVTEGGSSGSPIFDNNGLVIGTLSGGSSYCDETGSPDLYGKLSYHWTSNGTTAADQLQPWLDPAGTATTLEYYDPNNVGLTADFSGTPTTVNTGSTVTFTDLSSGGTITSRSWTFTGGTPATSTAAAPVITYNTAGTYNVSLTVYSSTDDATVTKTGYITVVTPGSGFTYDFEACTNFAFNSTAFSPCTIYDGDGSTTYPYDGIDFTNEEYTGSFIAFNPSATTPAAGAAWAAHGGSKYGACFAAETPANNDWFITPQIALQSNSSFSFWAKSVSNTYGLERFVVYVSTTNNSIGSFTKISAGTYIDAPTTWTQYTYNLSAYNNSSIYLAIQCVSNDAYVFGIDDIVITTSPGVTAPVANFSGTPTSGCANLSVHFTDASTNSPTSWLWTCPGGTPASSTQQNPTIIYNTAGTYNVTLKATNAGGNNTYTRTNYIVANDCSDVEDDIASQVSIYPNPTDGIININIPESRATVKISNVIGKEVKVLKLNSTENSIDLSSLSPGMYFVEVQLADRKFVSKLNIR